MIANMHKIMAQRKKIICVILLCGVFYTAIHFLYSGLYFPVKYSVNIGQIREEVAALSEFLAGGKFVITNPRQYGPFFILLITPFMYFYNSQLVFSNMLLVLVYLFIFCSIWLCFKGVFAEAAKTKEERNIVLFLLSILWLNFVPLLCILPTKSVESWELFFICLGFLTYIRHKYFWTGFSFAAATLIKLLPILFIIYFLFKERKVFLYSLLWMFIIMSATHFIYGPQIGLLYLPFLLTRPLGSQTFGASQFENTSIKGFVYKIASGFKVDPTYTFRLTPEAEKIAFIIATVIQILLFLYLIKTALRKNCSKEEVLVQFSLVSVFMMLLSPLSSFEYNTLLLFAYSAGLYLLFYTNLTKYLIGLYGVSYILVGNFFPQNLIVKFFPFEKINAYLGNSIFTPGESYRAYCLPLLGVILLAVFFIIIWHKLRKK